MILLASAALLYSLAQPRTPAVTCDPCEAGIDLSPVLFWDHVDDARLQSYIVRWSADHGSTWNIGGWTPEDHWALQEWLAWLPAGAKIELRVESLGQAADGRPIVSRPAPGVAPSVWVCIPHLWIVGQPWPGEVCP